MYEKEALSDKCTREKLFPVSAGVSGFKARSLKLFEACLKLLEAAALKLMQRDKRSHGKSIRSLHEYVSDLYCYLWTLHLSEEKQNRELKTLTKALISPGDLETRFLAWLKDNKSGRKPGTRGEVDPLQATGEDWNTTCLQRWAYYRGRFRRTLHEKGRFVRTIGQECFFSYGSKDLECLSRKDFQERLHDLASSFKPSLRDQDFWQGEEVFYNDGAMGKYEGPGMEKLDQFCEELFRHAGTVFGRTCMLSLNMVMDILPQCYTYFEAKEPLSISSSPEEDGKVTETIAEWQISGSRTWEQEQLQLRSFFEKNRKSIQAAVRSLDRTEALILCAEYNAIPRTRACKLIGLKSSGRMQEKFSKAADKLVAVLKEKELCPDMHRICDSDEGCLALDGFYMIQIFSFVWKEWKAEMAPLLGIDTFQETDTWD